MWDDLSAVGGPPNAPISRPASYVDWQERAHSFESIAAIQSRSLQPHRRGGEPERLAGVRTTPNLFATIGLQAVPGRTLLPDEVAGEPVVVVSEGFWLRRLGGDPAAVGRTITLDGSPHVVVGVVPRDFRFPAAGVDVFVPTVFAPQVLARPTAYCLVSSSRSCEPALRSKRRKPSWTAIAAALERETRHGPRVTAATSCRCTSSSRAAGPSRTHRRCSPCSAPWRSCC